MHSLRHPGPEYRATAIALTRRRPSLRRRRPLSRAGRRRIRSSLRPVRRWDLPFLRSGEFPLSYARVAAVAAS